MSYIGIGTGLVARDPQFIRCCFFLWLQRSREGNRMTALCSLKKREQDGSAAGLFGLQDNDVE